MTNKQYEIWKKSMRFFGRAFRCHQLSDRSFHICGVQLPLCARCTGMFLGLFLVGPVLCSILPVNMLISFYLVSIMVIDGYTQYLGARKSNNFLRLITGIGFGYSIVSVLAHIIMMIIKLLS